MAEYEYSTVQRVTTYLTDNDNYLLTTATEARTPRYRSYVRSSDLPWLTVEERGGRLRGEVLRVIEDRQHLTMRW